MNPSELKQELLPCELDHPYIFVSYSSNDREYVWKDVVELQRRGYNIWIDEANLDKSNESWKDDALKAIENNSCAIVLYYVSLSALASEPCLNELNKTRSTETIEIHFEPVDFIAIETEPVGTIEEYSNKARMQIEQSTTISGDEKNQQLRTLYRMINDFLPLDNNKVRILSRDDPDRVGDYYDDIIRQLVNCRKGRELRLSEEMRYRIALDRYIQGNYTVAKKLLELADGYGAADLLLAHMYYAGNAVMKADREKASALWTQVEEYCNDSWIELGRALDNEKYYSEALAYTLAYGEKNEDGDSMYEASKLWVKKGCRAEVIASLNRSIQFGTGKKASESVIGFEQTKEEDFQKAAKKYLTEETPISI